jgi:hypothetical protein
LTDGARSSPVEQQERLGTLDQKKRKTAGIQIAVCAENPIRVDDLTESPKAGGMIGLLCFVLAVLGSPFKSKMRLEAENAVLQHQLKQSSPIILPE